MSAHSEKDIAGNSESLSKSERHHIPELDGLRGFLSWWVVIGHVLLACGFSSLPRGFRVLVHGEYAVSVFIILSGYVISKLLHDGRESYWVFIGRRFCRLYPAFLVCLAFALLVTAFLTHSTVWVPYLPPELEHWSEIRPHLPAHLLAHLTLLHGAIPDSLLPYSRYALLGPAWSISLEWQFYLIAPLVAWLIARFGSTALLAVIVTFLVINFFNVQSSMTAFLPAHLAGFAVGIASYALLVNTRRSSAGEFVVVALAPLTLYFSRNLPLAIWVFSLGTTLADDRCRVASLCRAVLNGAFMQHLGRISYSTYLGHYPVLFMLQWLICRFLPHSPPQKMLLLLLPSTFLVTWLFSSAVYRLVEVPGIRLGRRLGRTPA